MKLRIILWVGVISCCIALGFTQRDDLSTVWREYSSLWRDFECEDHYPRLRKPAIRGHVARLDPEATAVATIRLCSYESGRGFTTLAENLLKFPRNTFLLYETAGWVCDDDVLDPKISLLLAKKLIEQKPGAANYYYLKAKALLADRTDNDIAAVLAEIEKANKYKGYDHPYKSYKQRVIQIANRAKLSRRVLSELSLPGRRVVSLRHLEQYLLSRANSAFTDGSDSAGFLIDDVLNRMFDTRTAAGDFTASALRKFNLEVWSAWNNPAFWPSPQILELRRAALTKDRARQNRLELCAWMVHTLESRKSRHQQKVRFDNYKPTELTMLALPAAAHSGKMVPATVLAVLALLAVSLVRGFGEKTKFSPGGIVLFAFAAVVYFLIANGPSFWFIADDWGCSGLSYMGVLRPPRIHLEDILDDPLVPSMVLLAPVITILILWGASFFKRKTGPFWKYWYIQLPLSVAVAITLTVMLAIAAYSPRSSPPWWAYPATFAVLFFVCAAVTFLGWWFFRCRAVRLILLAVFFGGLTFISGGYLYIGYVPILLFVVTSAVIAIVKPSRGISFREALFRLFSRKSQWTALRTKCTRLVAISVVIYWVLLMSLVPSFAHHINHILRPYRPPIPVAMPRADDAAYRRVLSCFDSEDSTMWSFALTDLVMPGDLPGVLEQLKKKGIDLYSRMYTFRKFNVRGGKQADAPETTIKKTDRVLMSALLFAGRDTVGIVADSMENLNHERALVARAKLGDRRVKDKLTELLRLRMPRVNKPRDEKKYKSYWDKPVSAAGIIAALACISEPNEAARQYITYINQQNLANLIENSSFFRGISLLPTIQARKVIKTYLAKARGRQPKTGQSPSGTKLCESPDRVLFPLHELLGIYGDRQIAETVLEMVLQAEGPGHSIERMEIWPYFTIESAPLLKEGLQSGDDDLHAWCVWQLRRVGYNFSDGELDTLLNDECWKVRANAVLAAGLRGASRAERDENGFVRFMASLLSGRKEN